MLIGYEVTLWNLEENENQTNNLSPKDNSLNLTDWASITADKKAIVSVKANNVKGMSQPSSIMLGLIGMCGERVNLWDVSPNMPVCFNKLVFCGP